MSPLEVMPVLRVEEPTARLSDFGLTLFGHAGLSKVQRGPNLCQMVTSTSMRWNSSL